MAIAGLGAAALPAQAGAAIDMVTNCNDSGAGSLPSVVASAASGDTVTFSVSCSLILLNDTIDLTRNISLSGPGSSDLAVSGGGTTGVFNISTRVTADISGLTMENGNNYDGGGIDNNGTLTVTDSTLAGNDSGVGGGISNIGGTLTVTDSTLVGNSANDRGGGIFNDPGSTATVDASTLSDDNADDGGGIYNEGTMTVTDGTLSGNSAAGDDGGGGILNYGLLDVTASTLSENDASDMGGGIFNGGRTSMAATVVADSGQAGDCSGSITDAGYNLDDDGSCGFSVTDHSQSGVDPDLGPLQNNRGPTDTQAPSPTSPVLDQIPLGTTGNSVTLCPGTDQRGVVRPQGTECDIGAVELELVPWAVTSPEGATATVGVPFSFTVTTSGIPVPSITKKGRLPRRLRFSDDGDGTATISGTPKRSGVYDLAITATFGTGTTEEVVAQTFKLTVVTN